MCRSKVAALHGRALVRQLDRLERHFAFGEPAALGYLLHDVTVAITGGKIHLAVDSAMSAITRIRLFGSFSATSVIWSAQESARFRSVLSRVIRAPTRRRFSISARRSMIGMAHNSP